MDFIDDMRKWENDCEEVAAELGLELHVVMKVLLTYERVSGEVEDD